MLARSCPSAALPILPLVAALLGGCATGNSYTEFYKDHTLNASLQLDPPAATAQVHLVSEAASEAVVARLFQSGFVIVGQSHFTGALRNPEEQMLAHAKAVGAAHVVASIEHDGTATGTVPVVTYVPPERSTTQTQGTVQANAYGPRATGTVQATYSETSTTETSPKFNTTHVPYSVDTYRYRAYFLRRTHVVFGAAFRPLTDAERVTLQRNGGAVVERVVDDSPSFNANILVGDILVALDGQPVGTVDRLTDTLYSKAGQQVAITLLRNGEERIVPVTLNPAKPATVAPPRG